MSSTEPERIHKLLSNAGLGSRRQIETWIRQGKVKVNGKLASIGDRIRTSDKISLDDKPVKLQTVLPTSIRIIACYKPAGLICTRNDPEGRKTVFDDLPRLTKGRWVNIGRLDINTTGLLLFSNNGELANRCMHPSSNIEREYAVRVLGTANDRQLTALREGIILDDGVAGFSDILDAGGEGTNHWYHVVLTEGRNREVRRLWESQGLKVSRLIRVRYGSYQLPRKKRPGQCWELDQKDIDSLLQDAGVTPAPEAVEPTTAARPRSDKSKPALRHPDQRRADPGKFVRKATDKKKTNKRKLEGRGHARRTPARRPSPTRK